MNKIESKFHKTMAKLVSKSVGQKRSIAIFSLKRSGQHAVIDWILDNSSKSYLFLNDVRMNCDPFFNMNGVTPFKSNRALLYFPNSMVKKMLPRHLLAYNFEDPDIEQVFCVNKNIGHSGRHDNVLVLRDIFNCFASRRRGLLHFKESSRVSFLIKDLWKKHAREFLGITSYLGENCIKISYNDFVFDEKYRTSCAKYLNINNIELSKKQTREGGGSSFCNDENLNFSDLMVRFRDLYGVDYIKNIFKNDRELFDLNFKIFGKTLANYKNEILRYFK
ncbi:hypothetical protein [Desulfosarcina alkanivorans]|nr:hypothetical protein [Desulfosarcina alkanivorans]